MYHVGAACPCGQPGNGVLVVVDLTDVLTDGGKVPINIVSGGQSRCGDWFRGGQGRRQVVDLALDPGDGARVSTLPAIR